MYPCGWVHFLDRLDEVAMLGLRPRKLAIWVTVAAYFNLNNPVLCGLAFNGWLVQEAVGPGMVLGFKVAPGSVRV